MSETSIEPEVLRIKSGSGDPNLFEDVARSTGFCEAW
jgi:hypothetical protein